MARTSPRPVGTARQALRSAAGAAAALVLVVSLTAGCTGSSGNDEAAPTTTVPATSSTTTSTSTTLPRFQTCDEIPVAKVSEILGVPLAGAQSVTKYIAGCQYLVDDAGAQLPAVVIEYLPVEDFDALHKAQPDAEDIPELRNGFAAGANLVIAEAESGTVRVSASAALPGGGLATLDQLVAVAVLAQDL